MKRKQRLILVASTSFMIILLTFLLPRYAQPLSYHDFADKRVFINIPNFFDVMSNIPIFVIGIIGYFCLNSCNLTTIPSEEKKLWKLFFFASILTAIFSAYYHLKPDNLRLGLDRLALSFLFMSFFCVILEERMHEKIGIKLLWPLIGLGILSVIYWITSEKIGKGDLRFYGLIQFGPMLLLPLVFFLFPPCYTGQSYLYLSFIFYMLAKIAEVEDRKIFEYFHQQLSGHTLKHLLSSISLICVIFYLRLKKRLTSA